MEDKKILLSIKNLQVKFHVRGRVLTAIRGVSLDIYENESIAIVGESGSGKSVFTKTFAGMLDTNGFISEGDIIYNDDELAETFVKFNDKEQGIVRRLYDRLCDYSKLEFGAETYREMQQLTSDEKGKSFLSEEEKDALESEIEALKFAATELYNYRQTLDPSKDKEELRKTAQQIAKHNADIKELEKNAKKTARAHKAAYIADHEARQSYAAKLQELKALYAKQIESEITPETEARNQVIAKEIYLSAGRFDVVRRIRYMMGLLKAFKKAMQLGVDLTDEAQINAVFDTVIFRVRYINEVTSLPKSTAKLPKAEIKTESAVKEEVSAEDGEEKTNLYLHGTCVLNLAKIKEARDWMQIRGHRIATVFQDPMTSLNPIITIGKQITSIILKHQNCSEAEARERAIILMKKVGIPNAENRFDDYPFQYSGGMRQRIVIAIALSCQPKILICDEPTTALDVTIQAQILDLLKDLQHEFGYTIVFITHDLGVVANIADRVAVLYAGQIVELGSVEDVFYDPRHPYTWALLSSLPQLAERNTVLYSISGTPPSLYNRIVGDPFAPRNPYCLKLDTLMDPPMFQISETHYAKTWLLDPRAPKVEKPEAIRNIHEKLIRAFNI